MYCYSVTRPLILKTPTQRISLTPPRDSSDPLTAEVRVAAQNEIEGVRRAVRAAYPDHAVEDILRLYAPENFVSLPFLPAVLGARAYADRGEEIPSGCLGDQLERLRQAFPERRRFRFLLINGFGTNLGDNLIGLSAFAHVLERIRSVVLEAEVDVMLGWHEDDRLERLYRGREGIAAILTQGMSLAELSGYDGVFDNSALLSLPRYGTMPMVDWYLWWMGIDSEGIPESEKRNTLAVPERARASLAPKLSDAEGMRILVNPAASTPLRSMPDSAVRRLIAELLARWPDARIVLTRPLADPRIEQLFPADVDELAALVERCDALIGVDTYTQHLADALGIPSLTLYTSVSPGLYPYYPLSEAVVLPNAQRLPGWGKPKFPPRIWKFIADIYEKGWGELDYGNVMDVLQRVMDRKKGFGGNRR
jgi:hypothetical protein